MTQKHGGIVCKYQNQNCMILIGEGEWCGVGGGRVQSWLRGRQIRCYVYCIFYHPANSTVW